MRHAILFAESFGSPLDWLAVIICVTVLGPLFLGLLLVVRDTIRQRGKWGINFSKASCTECGTPVPLFRKPANFQEMMWGGWTCLECGLELDKWGKPIEKQKTLAKFAVLKALGNAAEHAQRPQPEQDDRIQGAGPTGGEIRE